MARTNAGNAKRPGAKAVQTSRGKSAVITLNIHEAKTQLSKLVDLAAQGESVVIAKAGKPMVKVVALDSPAAPRRLGALQGEFKVPEDFDRMGEDEIADLFGVNE